MSKERFSWREVLKQGTGETDSVKGNSATKRADTKADKTSGKYQVKIVNGVKYMTLK